jgi:hypothetical protein
MARLNIEELVSGLLEAGMVAGRIAEKQHINNLANYFNTDGSPITRVFKIGDKNLEVPLYILADHSSMGLDELDVEFDARLIIGDNVPSSLKRSLLGFFKNKEDSHEHNIKSIEVDSGSNPDGSGMAKIKVKFKSDDKPEMVSRLVDAFIQNLDQNGTSDNPNANKPTPPDAPIDVRAFQDWMDVTHSGWINGKNLNKENGYGSFGPFTRKAWSENKSEFLNSK